MMGMPLKYNPQPFKQIDYKKEVEKELDEGRNWTAFLYGYTVLEAYLWDWFWMQVFKTGKRKEIHKKASEHLEKLSLKSIVSLHVAFGNITKKNYTEILDLSKIRNQVVHELVKLDLENKKVKKKLIGASKKAVELCDEVAMKYRKFLDERAQEIIVKYFCGDCEGPMSSEESTCKTCNSKNKKHVINLKDKKIVI